MPLMYHYTNACVHFLIFTKAFLCERPRFDAADDTMMIFQGIVWLDGKSRSMFIKMRKKNNVARWNVLSITTVESEGKEI